MVDEEGILFGVYLLLFPRPPAAGNGTGTGTAGMHYGLRESSVSRMLENFVADKWQLHFVPHIICCVSSCIPTTLCSSILRCIADCFVMKNEEVGWLGGMVG